MKEKDKPMTQPAYERLAEALKMRGGGVPVLHCREFFALMEELFTPEEADLAAKMPMGLVSAAKLAEETGGDSKVVEQLLESMANKGLLTSYEREEGLVYELLKLLPGIYEAQFSTGEVSERAKRVAHLFLDYFNAMTQLAEEMSSGRGPTGVAAAAIYIASILCNERRTQREVADIAGVTEVTIRNRYKELTEKLGIDVQL